MTQTNGGEGGGGGGSGPTTPATPAYEADVKAGNDAETTIPVTVDKDAGTASVDASSQNLASGGNVTVTMPSVPGVTDYTIGMPVANLTTPNGGTLTFNTDTGSLTLPSDMLPALPAEGKKRKSPSVREINQIVPAISRQPSATGPLSNSRCPSTASRQTGAIPVRRLQ